MRTMPITMYKSSLFNFCLLQSHCASATFASCKTTCTRSARTVAFGPSSLRFSVWPRFLTCTFVFWTRPSKRRMSCLRASRRQRGSTSPGIILSSGREGMSVLLFSSSTCICPLSLRRYACVMLRMKEHYQIVQMGHLQHIVLPIDELPMVLSINRMSLFIASFLYLLINEYLCLVFLFADISMQVFRLSTSNKHCIHLVRLI